MTNPYFNFTTAHNEQNLVENLVIESIQIYGMDITYCPKTLVDFDALLGEDPQKAFKDGAVVVETYMENIDGFEGALNFLNNFGDNIDKQVIFIVAKRRFDEEVLGLHWRDDWDATVSYSVDDAVHYNGVIYKSAVNTNLNHTPGTDGNWVAIQQIRPDEGDLIYLPITHDIFEVLFADHEEVFYQIGKIYVWKITCEKYRFNHEVLDTGIAAIDDIATELANNDSVVNDPLADNETIDTKISTFLNIDPKAPF